VLLLANKDDHNNGTQYTQSNVQQRHFYDGLDMSDWSL